MTRNQKIILVILAAAVVVGLVGFFNLRGRILRLAQNQKTEEQARQEVLSPPISTPTDVASTAKIFWAAGPDKVAESDIQMPLSADQVQRAKQVLHALIANSPSTEQRTIPADVLLLGFYILPDGTAIADFSGGLASEIPSGILSEQLAVDSIARTLESNVSGLRRLKILIHGQEVDTLAGHVDLTGYFDLNSAPASQLEGNAAGPGANTNASTVAAPAANAAAPSNKTTTPNAPAVASTGGTKP